MSVIVVLREAVKFWTIDPAVGGWGRVVPNLYKSLFFMAYLALFLPKISEKFTEKIPTFGEGGSSRLGQIPNFYRKFVLEASLILIQDLN